VTLNLAVQWRLNDPEILSSVQNLVFDSYQRVKPRTAVATPVRIVDIDEASLRQVGQWPWPRTTISRLVNKLSDMGAAVIAFDVVFAEPDRTAGSEIIRQLAEINWRINSYRKTLITN
jgi:adenylate cyclase